MNDHWLKLWYKEPAEAWENALPLGNGRIGGMIYGGVDVEHIQLNEDTLWSGYPEDKYNTEVFGYLEKVRKLIFEGKNIEAQEIIEKNMFGAWNQSYLPMADLLLKFKGEDNVIQYKRELDLLNGIMTINYTKGQVEYKRETFISAVDQVLVCHLAANKPNMLSFSLNLESQLKFSVETSIKDTLFLIGEAPVNVVPHFLEADNPITYSDLNDKRGMSFGVYLKVLHDGGSIITGNDFIQIENSNTVTLILSAATSFNGFNKHPYLNGKDFSRICEKHLNEAALKGYQELLKNHVKDHCALFKRLDISLGDVDRSNIPTVERLDAVKNGLKDSQLAAILFQYGRYLLISSSRPGTQAANLQGIWNKNLRPHWSSNYTININTQMNYWLAETCNLSECHEPLFDLINELSISGYKTADIYYRCRGWVAHHNVDIWRTAILAGDDTYRQYWACCLFWPMGGAWLCRHLWEHYEYTGDMEFLEKHVYPLIKGAAEFCLDWLVEDKDGYLVTNPSTSPENSYLTRNGERCGVGLASTMDISIIYDLFTYCIEASRLLCLDCEFRGLLEKALVRLPPLKIGEYGQIQEWLYDVEDFEIGHRHMSHLYGLYPGNRIVIEEAPEIVQAVKETIKRRLENSDVYIGGWRLAWVLNLYARLEDSEAAYNSVIDMLCNSVSSNLFNVHIPQNTEESIIYQIDGNFGISAGIAEMLLQSHRGEINLLPALPKEWPDGYVKGFKARGGFEVDMEWKEGILKEVLIKAQTTGPCKIRYGKAISIIDMIAGNNYRLGSYLKPY